MSGLKRITTLTLHYNTVIYLVYIGREERKETDRLEDQEENKLNKLNEGIIKGQELDPLSIGKLDLNEQRFENLEKKLNRLK